MICQNCLTDNKQDQPKQATHIVWCPTWITAHQGPIHLCEDHAENFSSRNPYANNGQFFWEQHAYDMFNSLETIITENDPQYQNAKNMILKGSIIKESPYTTIAAVDGKTWILSKQFIINLGDYFLSKQYYPKLFQ